MTEALPVPQADGTPWALFLDVDGTLLELAEHPDDVVVPGKLVPLLGALHRTLDGAVALVSGRSLSSLDTLLGGAGLDAAGCHGAEIRIGGRTEVLAAEDEEMEVVARRLASLADAFPHAMVEIKSRSVAFHFRSPFLDSRRARALVEDSLGKVAFRFRLLEGKRVVEILPADAGKGAAVARFLQRFPYTGRLPVYVGDDVTDEEGFREVNRRSGISIHVGNDEATQARFRAASVAQVLRWLAGPVLRSLGCLYC